MKKFEKERKNKKVKLKIVTDYVTLIYISLLSLFRFSFYFSLSEQGHALVCLSTLSLCKRVSAGLPSSSFDK
jgi:hypothetical protein